MNIKLLGHTQLSEGFLDSIYTEDLSDISASQIVALTAVRTCYSPLKPSEIVSTEGAKYFGQSASDGEGGSEADRLIRHIIASKHTSTLEHITYTFAIEGVSRSLLAQLTRHRVGFSYSVQSQRYVRFGSGDKSGGFGYVTPPSVSEKATMCGGRTGDEVFSGMMQTIQAYYNHLRGMGVPAEDARMVLPNAATCNLVLTVNLRALLDFYAKRRPGNGAQWEIADLAEKLREEVVKVDPWTAKFFK
ncbi:FAD-dependent thymidylate synthase [Paenibacillus terrigena]|uniref:FAD-dependent thymidylate synthase n=1 Tax=Paenibacillus terrigena TaxID=369333 RepID=UPI000375237E|nr:FAD-dependent thymidylate synthase [Paenibacillus terrigena]